MTSQPSLAQLQQENDSLRAELAQLRSRCETLQRSEAQNRQAPLLSTIAQVANLLLRSPDYTTVLPDVVRMLGEVVGSDRCGITQDLMHPSSGKPAVKFITEWCQGGMIPSSQATPELESALEWENLPEFRERFLRGESANFLIEQLQAPSREVLGGQGITSILVVPIMIGGQPWGQIGFDNCGEPRLYDEAEIAILRIAADSIAAAIERQAKDDELRKSEALYRSLFEISNEGIYRFEIEPPISTSLPSEEQLQLSLESWRLVEMNSAFCRQYEVSEPAQLIGKKLIEFYGNISEQTWKTNLAFMRNNYRIQIAETEEIGINEQKRYFLQSIVGDVRNGYLVGGWGVQSDITELRLAQQALLQAEQNRVAELAKTNQALKNSLDRLAANPDLNSFLGYVLLEIAQQLNLDLINLNLYDAATETLPWEIQIRDGQVKLKHQLEAPEALLRPATSSTPIWNILLETRQPFVVNQDNAREFAFQDTYEYQGEELNLQVAANLLLTLGDEPMGLLGLGSTQRTSFTSQELEIAQALTHQATLAIQLTRLAEEAKHASLLQERNRIAQDIHDTLAQAFGGILIQLQATQYFVKRNPDKAIEQFNTAIALAREGLAEARRSVWTLYDQSADYQSLEVALPQLAERLTANSTTRAIATITGTPYRIDPEIGQNLLRLAQKAINNALRHAHAQTIRLTLAYERDRLFLSIQDNGRGFDPSQPISGFGISSMKQRAEYLGGTLSLVSQPGMGTEVAIVVSTVVPNSQAANLAEYLPPEGASKPQ